ncbi:hypothetical protein BK138_35175 [Paenibacillus rhizosphaerae]|uniref:HTH tetR-type domain-containing protein n=1 Tax=Paenibacillus rhizosphaerae TaxID=297318 RepID=A0A1R1DWR3_9BACL|nr:hypothetical protein BK138_35175 [Paenibacillus rhizosphaerae]
MTAGLEVFCEKGFSSTTIDDISSKAGYTRGAFYVQFESKEDFSRKLIDYRREMRADTHEHLERLFDSGARLQEAVSYLAEELVAYITKSPNGSLSISTTLCKRRIRSLSEKFLSLIMKAGLRDERKLGLAIP